MGTQDIRVTVIVPVYNVQDYLDKCITSICTQTYHNLEILLIDDGSTDSSVQICKKYEKQDARIHVIAKANEGVAETRNLGIRMAKGEYITFVDADDWVAEEYIEHLLKDILDSQAEMSICRIMNVHADSVYERQEPPIYLYDKRRNSIYHSFYRYLFYIDMRISDCMVGSCFRILYKRTAIVDNGIFFPPCRHAEDLLFIISVMNVCNRISVINEPLYYYNCLNINSASRSFYISDYLNERLVYWNELQVRIGQSSLQSFEKEIILNSQHQWIYHSLLSNAVKQADRGMRGKELKQIKHSLFAERSLNIRDYLRWFYYLPISFKLCEMLLICRQYTLLRILKLLKRNKTVRAEKKQYSEEV